MSEELIVKYCSPTLAGMKTGNMFTCKFESELTLRNDLRRLNQLLAPKGIRILPMRFSEKEALIYVYRPEKLKEDLKNCHAFKLLKERGYLNEHPEYCVAQLVRRLKACLEFPHEIGLFLGYPPEDVQGFIDNKAGGYKCIGYWKVYGDEEKARRLFAKYKKCTAVYCKQWSKGMSVERLTAAV